MPRAAALGLGLGAAWGVMARVWMRLISTDPEFSWSGTLSIIGFSALLGLGVGVVHAARLSGRSGWWTLALVPGLVLFMSPGMLLAPCFLVGGLAWGVRGSALRVVGLLAVATSVAMAAVFTFGLPDGSGESGDSDLSGLAVSATGFLAMAVSLAWASSLVWQRRAPRSSPSDDGGAPTGLDRADAQETPRPV